MFGMGKADERRLQNEVLKRGIQMRRTTVTDLDNVFTAYPDARAVFNCTGLGSYHLKGVEDKLLYPTRVFPSSICLPLQPSQPKSQTTEHHPGPNHARRDSHYPTRENVFPLPSTRK